MTLLKRRLCVSFQNSCSSRLLKSEISWQQISPSTESWSSAPDLKPGIVLSKGPCKGHWKSEEVPEYLCPVCNRTCSNQSGLQRHIYVEHHSGVAKAYPCDLCDKSYSDGSNLKRHQREAHEGKYKHVCQVCHKGFSNINRFRGHLVSHGGEPEHSCHLCSRRFKYKEQLQNHVAKDHASVGLQRTGEQQKPEHYGDLMLAKSHHWQ